MKKDENKELAKRLVLRAIENYKRKFMLQEDLLNGEDRSRVLREIEQIEDDIKKGRVQQLEATLHRWCLEDRDEDFELWGIKAWVKL